MANRIFRFYSTAPQIVFDHAKSLAGGRIVRLDGFGIGGPEFWKMTIVIEEGEGADRFASWLEKNCRERDFKPGPRKNKVWTGSLHRPGIFVRSAFWMKNSVAKLRNVIKPS